MVETPDGHHILRCWLCTTEERMFMQITVVTKIMFFIFILAGKTTTDTWLKLVYNDVPYESP